MTADVAELADELAAEFTTVYGRAPVGVWSAPGRVNVIGEHTDYNAGLALPLALPQRTYAAVATRDDGVIRVRSRQSDEGWTGRLAKIGPGRPTGWAAYAVGVAWALAEQGHAVPGLDVLVDGRVPLGAGLSSSAALTCSVAVALADLVAGDRPSLDELVEASVTAENVVAGAATGGLDQTVSLRAETGHALLLDCRDGSTTSIPWSVEELGWTLLVTDTKAPHALVDGAYAKRRAQCEQAARLLGVDTLREVDPAGLDEVLARLDDDVLRRRTRHVVTEIARVAVAADALRRADLPALGAAMSASHVSLRDDYEVSCRELDLTVETVGRHGGLGARMTGGGFGGSAIALVRRDAVADVAAAVREAFARSGLTEPAQFTAVASAPAGRDR